MRWPRNIYEFRWGRWPYRVGDAVLLARDGYGSGQGRFLYRGSPPLYFLVDMAASPPTITVGPGLNPFEAFDGLPVKYYPRRVAVWPDSWGPEWGTEVETFPVPFRGHIPVDELELEPRGLNPASIPHPEGVPNPRTLKAVVGGRVYQVDKSLLIARDRTGALYRTPGGRYFSVVWVDGRPLLEIFSAWSARMVYWSSEPAADYKRAFAGADFGSLIADDGWRVPPYLLFPFPEALAKELPEFTLYLQTYRPADCRILAWGPSQLGTGEWVLELLVETPDGEAAELIWAGGQDVRVLPRGALDLRFAYERLPYKVAAPEEVYDEGVEEA